MEKIPEGKRYSLSKESFAKDRIIGVRNALEKIFEEKPEIVGATLFGSLVKGDVREESDIDMHVFINADEVSNSHANEEDLIIEKKFDFNSRRGEEIKAGTFRWKDLRRDIADEYAGYVRLKLKEEMPSLDDDQLNHIIPTVITEDILGEYLEDILHSYKEYPEGALSKKVLIGSPTIKEGEAAKADTENSRVEPNQMLYSMFFLAVGNGLKPYRKYIIDKLVMEGEAGESVWKDLIRSTEGWEQKISFYEGQSDKKYPRTLEEATRVYG